MAMDYRGERIKLHDVLQNIDTSEIVLVVRGKNEKTGKRGLAIENTIAGIHDWLDVYPDETFLILGSAEANSDAN